MSAQPSDEESLWRSSGTWRWTVCLATLALGLGFIGAPWQPRAAGPLAAAKYTPPAGDPTPAQAPPPGPAVSPPPVRGADGMDVAASTTQPLQSTTPPPPSTGGRQSFSSVAWNSVPGAGTVSGGGLIAAHCCAGPGSTVWATRAVSGGRHYWELTLSTQPGEPKPSTWSSAGIAGHDETKRHMGILRPQRPGVSSGRLSVDVGRDGSIRGGDVLMFAVDADRKLGYWGVNGQWRNGTPGETGGTSLELAPGEQLKPYAIPASPRGGAVEGDRWLANFGASKFRFAVPAGFDSYGASSSASSIAPGRPSTAALPPTAPAPPAVPDSMMGKLFQNTVIVGGQTVPLPEGRWQTLAHFKGSAQAPGDAMLLGRVADNQVKALVAVHAHRAAAPGAPPKVLKGCQREDVIFYSGPDAQPDLVRCWWVNHATNVWQDQPLFRAAQLELTQRKIEFSGVYLNVAFYRATPEGFATTFYYVDPAGAGIDSRQGAWSESEWRKDRLAADGTRAAFAEKTVNWGRDWAPIYFASK